MATMPTSAPSNKRTAGFTLIEMLVVLTILGLVAVIASQRLGERPASLERGETIVKLRSAIARAAQDARRSGNVQEVDVGALFPGRQIESVLASPRAGPGIVLVYPDGSTSGATIRLAGTAVSVDWLNGEVLDAS